MSKLENIAFVGLIMVVITAFVIVIITPKPLLEPGIIINPDVINNQGERMEFGTLQFFEHTPLTVKLAGLVNGSIYTLFVFPSNLNESPKTIYEFLTKSTEKIITFQAVDGLLILFRDGKIVLNVTMNSR